MLTSNIDKYYVQHDCERITQGDILRDFSFFIVGKENEQIELSFPYLVVVSQDCDLEQGFKINTLIEAEEKPEDGIIPYNQYLHSVLLLPAFPSEIIRKGEHLIDLYKLKTQQISTKLWDKLKQNNDQRYHYLPQYNDFQIPDLLIDFKAYYSLPFLCFQDVFRRHYLATINELFRENLSQRFANYLNRIGLPVINS